MRIMNLDMDAEPIGVYPGMWFLHADEVLQVLQEIPSNYIVSGVTGSSFLYNSNVAVTL